MVPSTNKVYLISGSNRRIGLGLVKSLVSRNYTTVYAGCRDPSTADELKALQQSNKNLVIVKLISTDLESNKATIAQIEKEAGTLNVIIANAGIAGKGGAMAKASLTEFRDTFEVNTLGPLMLFQNAQPLLAKNAVFAIVSSSVGSIGLAMPLQVGGYGASKATVNWVSKQIAVENRDMIAFALHPGWVETDMGNAGASGMGMKAAPHTIEDCINGILRVIDDAKKERNAHTFLRVLNHGILSYSQ